MRTFFSLTAVSGKIKVCHLQIKWKSATDVFFFLEQSSTQILTSLVALTSTVMSPVSLMDLDFSLSYYIFSQLSSHKEILFTKMLHNLLIIIYRLLIFFLSGLTRLLNVSDCELELLLDLASPFPI